MINLLITVVCQHFQEVFPNKVERIVTTDEEGYESITIKYPYDTYSDKALYELLSSSEWQSVSESTLEESPIKGDSVVSLTL